MDVPHPDDPSKGLIGGVTPRQRDTLAFIRGYILLHGTSPSYQEIAVGIGCKGRGNVHRILNLLEARGMIEPRPLRQTRGINVTPRGMAVIVRDDGAPGIISAEQPDGGVHPADAGTPPQHKD